MKTGEFIKQRLERLRMVLRELKKSLQTERTYIGCVRRYLEFAVCQPDKLRLRPEELIRRYVQHCGEQWAVATQDQFRKAVVAATSPMDLVPRNVVALPTRGEAWQSQLRVFRG